MMCMFIYFLSSVDPLPQKRILRANETRLAILDLEENKEYTFRVSANTSIGRGDIQEADVRTGPQEGKQTKKKDNHKK